MNILGTISLVVILYATLTSHGMVSYNEGVLRLAADFNPILMELK